MARTVDVVVDVDTSRLDGFVEFIDASAKLERYLEAQPQPTYDPEVNRWRAALHALKGKVGVKVERVAPPPLIPDPALDNGE